jgi:hypothetical protein
LRTFSRIALGFFLAKWVFAGCTSTEVTKHTSMQTGQMACPERTYVFAAHYADISSKIKTVVSFLLPAEIKARGASRVPAGVKEVSLPIEAGNMGDLTLVVSEARDTGDFSKNIA